MTTPKNHTLDTVCRMLGGHVSVSWVLIPPYWEAVLRACGGNDTRCMALIHADGPTRAVAIAALEAKLRECAKAVLSDEWDWEE